MTSQHREKAINLFLSDFWQNLLNTQHPLMHLPSCTHASTHGCTTTHTNKERDICIEHTNTAPPKNKAWNLFWVCFWKVKPIGLQVTRPGEKEGGHKLARGMGDGLLWKIPNSGGNAPTKIQAVWVGWVWLAPTQAPYHTPSTSQTPVQDTTGM